MKYLITKNSVKKACFLFMIATFIISIICMLNFNATSKTLAFAEDNERDDILPVSYAWSQGIGIPIDVLDNEINYTLDTAIDNWFHFNCNTSGTYGFKFYYQSENVSEYLKLGMEVSNSDSLTEVTNKKTLPYISYDSRKAIVFNFNLVAGNTYNFNFFLDNPDDYGIYYLDATIILSQWNSIDTAKLNNDVIIENNDEQDIYHLVAGQEYKMKFTYKNMELSASDMKSVIFYDEKMTSLITSYNNENLAYEELSAEKCGVSVNVRNGQKIKAKSSNLSDIGTMYIVDFERIYSIKFKVVEKPYESIANFDNSNYKLNLQIKDSYGNQLNSTSQFTNIKISFQDIDIEKEINIGETDIINLPFVKERQTMYVKVTYTVPKMDNDTYAYTETHSIEVLTEILDMANFSEVSTNKRIILIKTPNQNKTIRIGGPIETIILDSVTSNNIYLDISGTQSVTIIMKNTNLSADTNLNVIKSSGSKTIFHLIGDNIINGKYSDDKYLVHVNELVFQGDGTLNIIGQAGDNGYNGNTTSIDGSNGQKGTNAVFCNSNVIIPSGVTIIGGDGGNGGHGFNQTSANSKNGGHGGNGGNAGVGLTIGSSHYYLGFAGIGGNGGNGGDGANGRDAYISRFYYQYNGVSHDLYKATIGGNGGNGGNAGSNGSGSTDHITEHPRGGDGGDGGEGGNGLATKAKENGNVPPPSIVIQATIKYESPSAAGGDGGHGGDGYIGGIGGNGGNGGNGADGFDAVFLGSTGSNGGDGANGGNGGNGGDSWANTTYPGGSGGSGAGGGSGGIKGDGILTDYVDGQPGEPGLDGARGSGKTSSTCVTAGTLITLADGRKVSVENLTGTEMLLVWNMFTGKFESAPILFIDKDARTSYEVINLYFSDGTTVKVISEHGFWDITLNKYVFLRNDAAQYIGHWFNKQTTDADGNMIWTAVELVGVEIKNEVTVAYSPVTYSHLCYYVNGMLSMPGATTGLINIFEVDAETMQYDQELMLADIEEFGLFTYEEFNEILPVPQEIFDAFDAQYFKVAIAKGLTTMEDLAKLIENYSRFFEIE